MKTNQNHQRIAAAFDKLFRTYGPQGQGNSPEEIARDRIERIKVYFDAVALYAEQDVELAVDNFLAGSAPGHNPSFAPPAPLVGAECRRVMNLRLDRERDRRPALPPPDVPEATPEERARVKARIDTFVASVAESHLTDEAAAARRESELLQRTNARFMPDMSPNAMAHRLNLPSGYSLGAPESDREAE